MICDALLENATFVFQSEEGVHDKKYLFIYLLYLYLIKRHVKIQSYAYQKASNSF